MKKNVSFWVLIGVGLVLSITGRVLDGATLALIGILGDFLILIGVINGVTIVLQNRKNKRKTNQSTSVSQKAHTEAPVRSQHINDNSARLAKSKVWRLMQILYFFLATVVFFVGVGLFVNSDPNGSTLIGSLVFMGVIVVGAYFLLKWAVEYVAYGKSSEGR